MMKRLMALSALIVFMIGCVTAPDVKTDPITGVWKSGAFVQFPDENDPEKVAVEFTVDTTLTINADGTLHLINLLVGFDPDGPFTATEEYTGTWKRHPGSENEYDMEADDIAVWGSGTGTYHPDSDSFSTVWFEPRGEFNTQFTRNN